MLYSFNVMYSCMCRVHSTCYIFHLFIIFILVRHRTLKYVRLDEKVKNTNTNILKSNDQLVSS